MRSLILPKVWIHFKTSLEIIEPSVKRIQWKVLLTVWRLLTERRCVVEEALEHLLRKLHIRAHIGCLGLGGRRQRVNLTDRLHRYADHGRRWHGQRCHAAAEAVVGRERSRLHVVGLVF